MHQPSGPHRRQTGRVVTPALAWLLAACSAVLVLGPVHRADAQTLPRDFVLPTPLFAPNSAWNQLATGAAVLPQSDQQILVLYRVLLGDPTGLHGLGFPLPMPIRIMFVNYDQFTVPVFRAGAAPQTVLMRDYAGTPTFPNPKLPLAPDGTVTVPAPAGVVRPSGPAGTNADGHLVLYGPATFVAHDFWNATTALDAMGRSLGGGQPGPTILQTGAIDFFDVREAGANPLGYSSTRAVGTPLLGGLLLPEDVARGAINHALTFAIPGPRNTNPADPSTPRPSDIFYPASTTEARFFNENPLALAAGQRIRLKPTIVGFNGLPIDEATLAPITRMFLSALRTYGAYLVDNSFGFSIPAEDSNTAVLNLTNDQVNGLIGQPPGTPLPSGRTRWQAVLDTLNRQLEAIPIAVGPPAANPATATIDVANLEVVEPAAVPGSGFTGGVYVAAGNLAGPGPAQIITGPGPGLIARVRAFNADGTPRPTDFLVYPVGFTGGVRVAACDFDGDGRTEIVTGAGPTGGPHVRIIKLDPATGQPATDLANFMAYDPGMTAGLFVACGDVDGDGKPELILGVDAGGGPHVRVFKYTPGAPGGVTSFFDFFAYDPGFRGGIRVAAGNVDGSDRASIITGAGPGGGPHVRVLKWTGSALVEQAGFFAYVPSFSNGIFVAAGDVLGTGRAQIITSADAGGGPHVRVWTGTGGDTGVSFFAYAPSFTGGVRLAVGNVDGAGAGEIITAAGPGGGPHVRAFTGTGVPTSTSFLAY